LTPRARRPPQVLTAYKAVPDPKDPGQLLYDQSMCERVHAALQVGPQSRGGEARRGRSTHAPRPRAPPQDLIGAGYTPEHPVSLDPPMDELPGGGGGSAPAAAAGAGSAPAPAGPPPQTPAQMALMVPLRPAAGAPAPGSTEARIRRQGQARAPEPRAARRGLARRVV